jgi:hypothetical protein
MQWTGTRWAGGRGIDSNELEHDGRAGFSDPLGSTSAWQACIAVKKNKINRRKIWVVMGLVHAEYTPVSVADLVVRLTEQENSGVEMAWGARIMPLS